MAPKLLYLSCHQELEANEVTTFRNLGFDVFTAGYYTYGSHLTDPTLRPIPGQNDPELQAYFDAHFKDSFKPGWYNAFTKDFFNKFDVIINVHFAESLELNWNALAQTRNKLIIHRRVGQGNPGYERILSKYLKLGLPFIGMCETERLMYGYCGHTDLIRSHVDDTYFTGWTGEKEQVLTVQKWMSRPGGGRMYPEWQRVTAKFAGKRILAGRENQSLPDGLGDVPDDVLLKLRQESRIYFAVASRPAPLTFTLIEAMLVGMPVVSVGTRLAGYPWFEPPTFIKNGVNGFVCDSLEGCTSYIELLLTKPELGRTLGQQARKTAQQMVSPNIIAQQWKEFFAKHGVNL